MTSFINQEEAYKFLQVEATIEELSNKGFEVVVAMGEWITCIAHVDSSSGLNFLNLDAFE